ncbi:hypothetical protein, partial [uncultured Sphingosinicella sp.]|uniref:hypothetical protein n=1 Tax=uncultured Sphingosinicella sp. TaxID=478748 RepID=UPI0030DA471F
MRFAMTNSIKNMAIITNYLRVGSFSNFVDMLASSIRQWEIMMAKKKETVAKAKKPKKVSAAKPAAKKPAVKKQSTGQDFGEHLAAAGAQLQARAEAMFGQWLDQASSTLRKSGVQTFVDDIKSRAGFEKIAKELASNVANEITKFAASTNIGAKVAPKAKPGPKPKAKPGPKPKAAAAKPAAAAPAKPKGKPGPKPKIAAAKPAVKAPVKPKGKPGPKPKAAAAKPAVAAPAKPKGKPGPKPKTAA